MHRQLPVRSLHFDKSLTMQAAHHIFQSIATSTRRTYSSAERHFMRFCLFNNLISSENPFLLARESPLIHFVTHLANWLSHGTISVYLAAVNNLYIEFELSSMSLLFKTLCGIKRSLGISGAIAPSHHSFNPPPNISCPTTLSVHGHGFFHVVGCFYCSLVRYPAK